MSHTANDFATTPPTAPPTEPCAPPEDPSLWEDHEPPLRVALGREPFDAARHLLPPEAPAPRGLTTKLEVIVRAGATFGFRLELTAGCKGYGPADAAAGKPIPRVCYRVDRACHGDSEVDVSDGCLQTLLEQGESLWREIDTEVEAQQSDAAEQAAERAMGQ